MERKGSLIQERGREGGRPHTIEFVETPRALLFVVFVFLFVCFHSASTDPSPPQTSPKYHTSPLHIRSFSLPHPTTQISAPPPQNSPVVLCLLPGTQNPFAAPLSSTTRRRGRRIRLIRRRSCIALPAIRLGQGVTSKATDCTAFVYHNRHAKGP